MQIRFPRDFGHHKAGSEPNLSDHVAAALVQAGVAEAVQRQPGDPHQRPVEKAVATPPERAVSRGNRGR